jgi:hypothetical protein
MPSPEDRDQLSIDEIIASFEVFDGKYKREEVEAAIDHKDEIVPRLLAILENVLANPEEFAEDENYSGHTYALMLLGHLREPKAHPIIVGLCGLPGDLPYRLFGDLITEDMPVVLLRTCDGSVEAIKGLVCNKNADDYCRGSAAEAIMYGVAEGIVTREEALSFLGGLFEGDAANASGAFYDMVACCIHDLYPDELMGTIEEAYRKGYIHSGYIGLDDFQRAISRGKEQCLLDLQGELERRSLDDLHESMSWWACFEENPQDLTPAGAIGGKPSDAERKKARRKVTKASRKKNRKRKKR